MGACMARRGWWIGTVVILLVAGCGGGGSGGGGSATSTDTGLIPAAPTLGETLYQDASVLRPLVDGGVWTYRGTESQVVSTSGVIASTLVYENKVVQTSVGTQEFKETASNAGNDGTSTQTVSVQSGNVHETSMLTLTATQGEQLNSLILRSPVRVGDQFTEFDRRINGADDIDADGRPDTLDLAIYTQIIGLESVDLPNAPATAAVHAQTHLLSRYKLSSTDQWTSIVSTTVDGWYAAGLGLIQQRTEIPSDTAGYVERNTEVLVKWDGVGQGLGAMEPQIAKAPSGSPLNIGVQAAGFGSHALLMSFAGTTADSGITLTSIDQRGQSLASQSYQSISAWGAKIFGMDGQAKVVRVDADGLRMYSFDENGGALDVAGKVLRTATIYSPDGISFAGAASGDVLWLAWVESYASEGAVRYRLLAQPFDLNGGELATPSLLGDASAYTVFTTLRVDAYKGAVAITWRDLFSVKYAVPSTPGSLALEAHTLVADDGAFNYLPVFPVALESRTSLLMQGRMVNGARPILGIGLQDSGDPLWSVGSSDLLAQKIKQIPSIPVSLLASQSRGLSVDFFCNAFEKLWNEDSSESNVQSVFELSPGTGALADDAHVRLLARDLLLYPDFMVGLDDTVLVFANYYSGQSGLWVSPVWRRKGV